MKTFRLKKWHIIVGSILLFFIVILFAAPRIARWYIMKKDKDLIGREIEIEKIRINYFTGKLRIKDLKLYEADDKIIFVSLRQLKANIDYFPLLRNEIVVSYISLDDPYVQVLQDGPTFNFSDLISSDKSSPGNDTIPEDTTPKEPTRYIINNISINRGFIKYTDIPLDHTISLDSFDLKIPGFVWNSDTTNLDVGFSFVDGGGFYSSLTMNQADSTYLIDLELDSLNLGIIEPYVRNSMYISSLGGYLTSDLQIKVKTSSILQLFVSGINHINGFQIQDTLNRIIFSFNDLTVAIDTFQLDQNRIRIDSVTLRDPFILFELIDTTNNWLALIKPAKVIHAETADTAAYADIADVPDQSGSPEQSVEPTDSSQGFSYNLPRIAIYDGHILFSDKTLAYPFEYKIENLKIESSGIPENPEKISVVISALLNGNGVLQSDGTINTVDPGNDMDLALEISQFRMKDMDAYFKDYLGFPVNGGIMNFKTANQLRPGSLVSENNIYFRGFRLDEKLQDESRLNIPLRLAIGVLTDKDGIIDLKAPVKMKGDEVKIGNLARIIFRVIGNLFIKAAVSPVNLLAGLYEADPASLQEIQLGFTEAAPDEKNLKSLDIIARILNDKPQLNVDFIYSIDKAKAADSLAYILTIDDYMNKNTVAEFNRREIVDSILIRYLLNKPFASSLPADPGLDILCRNYIGADQLDVMLDSLKSSQCRFMSGYLGSERAIPPDRFRVIETAPDTVFSIKKYPSFRVYFTPGE